MTALKGTNALLLADEFNFSGDTAGFTVTVGMGEQDATVLTSTAMLYAAILPSMGIEHNGYVQALAAADQMEGELFERITGAHYVSCLLGTAVTGCPAYTIDSTFVRDLKFGAPATGLLTINGSWGKGAGGSRGLRIYTGTLSATGTQTSIDFTSAGSAGGECYLHVTAKTGTMTNTTILVESSATEGGAYATEATFTVSALGGYKALMSGTVNRWLRVNLSSLGGATNVTIVVIACVDGVTQ